MSSLVRANYTDPSTGSLQVMEPNSNSLGGNGGPITIPPFILPIATKTTLGAVIIGDNISVDANGKISVAAPGSGGTNPIGPLSFSAVTDDTITAPRLLAMKANGHFALASNVAEGMEPIGLCTTSVAAGATATIVFANNLITGLTGLVPGASYYLGTGGGLVTGANAPTATNSVLLKVGTALSTSTLLYAPEMPITL
jgi:hypothetical protein